MGFIQDKIAKEVGGIVIKKLVSENEKIRKQYNKELCDKLDGWEAEIRKTIQEIITEELDKKIEKKIDEMTGNESD